MLTFALAGRELDNLHRTYFDIPTVEQVGSAYRMTYAIDFVKLRDQLCTERAAMRLERAAMRLDRDLIMRSLLNKSSSAMILELLLFFNI